RPARGRGARRGETAPLVPFRAARWPWTTCSHPGTIPSTDAASSFGCDRLVCCEASARRVVSPAVDGRGELGRRGEDLAAELLRARGYTIVERNFRCRAGEIDLVAFDGPTVVFVEVRSRRGERVGTPLESVDPRKH